MKIDVGDFDTNYPRRHHITAPFRQNAEMSFPLTYNCISPRSLGYKSSHQTAGVVYGGYAIHPAILPASQKLIQKSTCTMPSLTRPLIRFALLSLFPVVAIQHAMPLSTEQSVDLVEIQQVVNLFPIAVDQHRLELLPHIFTSDVVANFSLPDGTIQNGLDAVTQNLMTLQDTPSLHDQSTNYVDFKSPQQANATTYLTGMFFGSADLQGQVFMNYGR